MSTNPNRKPNWVTQAAPSWGLMRISQNTKIALSETTQDNLLYTYDANSAGQGVTVYVFDTGFDPNHEDYRHRVVERYFNAFAPCGAGSGSFPLVPQIPDGNQHLPLDGQTVDDLEGHGTWMAGIIAGKTYGVAKAARLVSVKVVPSRGWGIASDGSYLIAGLRWVLDDIAAQKVDPTKTVVNMSINAARPIRRLDTAVENVVARGITVVVAAGNMGRLAQNVSPAGATGAIIVGGTDVQDRILDVTNHGQAIDVFAPSQNIITTAINPARYPYLSADPPSLRNPDFSVHNEHGVIGYGSTSAACAHVSGLVACLLSNDPDIEAARQNICSVPAAVKAKLLRLAASNPLLEPREKHLNSLTPLNCLVYNGAPADRPAICEFPRGGWVISP